MNRTTFGLLGVSALLFGSLNVASAADLPYKAPPPPPVDTYTFSGIYVGLSVEDSHDKFNWAFNPPNPAGIGINQAYSFGHDDYGADWHIGLQYQWNFVVFGVEGGEISATNKPAINPFFGVNNAELSNAGRTAIEFAGGRLGLAWNRFMVYGTGGWAHTSIDSFGTPVGGGLPEQVAQTNGHSGSFYGGGIEYLVSHASACCDIVVGADYKHFNFNTTYDCVGAANLNPPVGVCLGAAGGYNDRNIGASTDVISARISFKTQGFGYWGGPVAARY